jgi:hypothetical protein
MAWCLAPGARVAMMLNHLLGYVCQNFGVGFGHSVESSTFAQHSG